ncbi:hypothetical protein [Micromonospora globbae]|uniref:Alkaline shock response membrane anchor protein AmaP n=1 Tax=Micromonospora globbae TaxID=1894969 RepID=A0A420F720_9ACTN|nr:hypothetical protein [Micromonospora globbae]RKF28705.1 hypothetical protein D7I43_02890 [Micromonospora globbae]
MSNAAHRVLWTALALLLVAAGGVALALNLGLLPGVEPGDVILGAGLRRAWRLAAPWSALAAAAAGLLAAAGGLWLLRRELRAARGAWHGTLARPGRRGRTRLAAAPLARALERDLTGDPRVRRARVVLTGDPPRPDLWVRVEIAADARTAGLREHVGTAIRRYADTAGCRPAHLDVTARLDAAPGPVHVAASGRIVPRETSWLRPDRRGSRGP